MRFFSTAILAASLSTAVVLLSPARGQLMLPGAVGAGTGESAGSGAPARTAAQAKPVVTKPPGEETIIGHELARNGATGSMSLERSGTDLGVAHLTLQGEQISKPGEQCRVDVAGTPIAAKFTGRPAGLSRYDVDLQVCPFSFDVLDGAALVSSPHRTCDFVAADCRVDLTGLWGPRGNSFTAARTKEMERTRIHAEAGMRANFHILLARAGKDKFAIKEIARQQAGFSSDREETCRDYSHEETHGFCALQITEARNLALLAKLGAGAPGDATASVAKAPKRKPRPIVQAPIVQAPAVQAPAENP